MQLPDYEHLKHALLFSKYTSSKEYRMSFLKGALKSDICFSLISFLYENNRKKDDVLIALPNSGTNQT